MRTLVALVMLAVIACPGASLAGDGNKVKGSKSNTSERAADADTEEAKTVKGSKSNSDNRTSVKSGKSNSDNRVHSGKSNSSSQ